MSTSPRDPHARFGFIPTCFALFRQRRTGVLEVRAAGIDTFLYFKTGGPVFAEQGTLGETLGRLLVKKGLLTQGQYGSVIERMTEEIIENEQVRFGEIAIALGILTPEQVHHGLLEQTRRKFLHCLQWDDCTYEFHEVPEALAEVPHYPMALPPLVLEGVRLHFDGARIEAVLGGLAGRFASVRAEPKVIVDEFGLGGEEYRLLRRLDGSSTLYEVLGEAGRDRESLRAVLVTLILANVVRLADEPLVVGPSTPLPGRPRSDSIVVADRKIAPPTPASAPSAPARPGWKRASGNLHPPPEVRRSRLQAEKTLQQVQTLVADSRWAAAAAELRQAVALYPEAIDYKLWLGWTEFRASEARAEPPQRLALRSLARDALVQDKNFALAHHVLGHLLMLEGDHESAATYLRTALRLDPANTEAKQRLALLARRRAAAPPSVHPPVAPGRRVDRSKADPSKKVAALIEKAELARAAGEDAAAESTLREALALAPDDGRVMAELALTMMRIDPRRASREASSLARKARKLSPDLPIPYVVLGMLMEEIRDPERAAQLYRHALSLDEECDEARARLERLGSG